MDSADSEVVKLAMRAQGARLHEHEQHLSSINQGLRVLTEQQGNFQSSVTEQVNLLTDQLSFLIGHVKADPSASLPAMTPTPASENTAALDHARFPSTGLRLAAPDKFSGDSGDCRPFLVLCDLHFKHNPAAFVSDQARIAFVMSHLTGRAAAWATAEWSRDSIVCQTLSRFTDTMSRVFDHSSPAREASRMLMQIKQHNRPVTDYAIEFRTLAADSGWNDPALIDAFMNGLTDSIKDQLAPLELPTDLDIIISMATRIDNRLQERRRERLRTSAPFPRTAWTPQLQPHLSPGRPALTKVPEEPMQLGRAKVTPEERQRRKHEGCCFYCGQPDHQWSSCPAKGQARR